MARVVAAGISVNVSRVLWGTGVKSESVSNGMAAAVFSPGGGFVKD